MTEDPDDAHIRLAAVEHVRHVSTQDTISSLDLRAGFVVDGRRIPLVNPQRGIFKPAAMKHLLSIRTVYPTPRGRIWYDDQREVHAQIARGDEFVDYDFMGKDPGAPDNRWLREARDNQIPILYFLGVAPQRYAFLWPVYVAEWSAAALKVRLAFGVAATAVTQWSVPEAPERRYGLRLVRQRLHQATFREAILSAYGNRCAISRLPEPRLLDAAHIVPDRNCELGQPVVPNGLPLSKIHHAAFDANLIGIDADYRIHVSAVLLAINDGPMFEHGLKAMAGQSIRLPIRRQDYPDRDRLAERFQEFKAS